VNGGAQIKGLMAAAGTVPISKTRAQAGEIKNTQIAEELALPPVKIHCSILAEDAIKAAIADYHAKHVVEVVTEAKAA